MDITLNRKILSRVENIFEELSALESIIKLTKDACYEQESVSNYYNLNAKEKLILSAERNHYINLLNIALDKVTSLQELNILLEKEISYL